MTALGVEARKTGLQSGWVWELPKVLNNPEDAHQKELSTFGEDDRSIEDAHLKNMSTFGSNEHLRDDGEVL